MERKNLIQSQLKQIFFDQATNEKRDVKSIQKYSTINHLNKSIQNISTNTFVPFLNERDHIGRLVTKLGRNQHEKLFYKQKTFFHLKTIKHMCGRKYLPSLKIIPQQHNVTKRLRGVNSQQNKKYLKSHLRNFLSKEVAILQSPERKRMSSNGNGNEPYIPLGKGTQFTQKETYDKERSNKHKFLNRSFESRKMQPIKNSCAFLTCPRDHLQKYESRKGFGNSTPGQYHRDDIEDSILPKKNYAIISKTDYRKFKIDKNKDDPHYIDTPRNAPQCSKTKHISVMRFAKRIGRLDPKTRLKQKGKAALANERYINYWLNVVTFDTINKKNQEEEDEKAEEEEKKKKLREGKIQRMQDRKQFNKKKNNENLDQDSQIPKIGEYKPEVLQLEQDRILNKYNVSFQKKEGLKKKPRRNKEANAL